MLLAVCHEIDILRIERLVEIGCHPHMGGPGQCLGEEEIVLMCREDAVDIYPEVIMDGTQFLTPLIIGNRKETCVDLVAPRYRNGQLKLLDRLLHRMLAFIVFEPVALQRVAHIVADVAEERSSHLAGADIQGSPFRQPGLCRRTDEGGVLESLTGQVVHGSHQVGLSFFKQEDTLIFAIFLLQHCRTQKVVQGGHFAAPAIESVGILAGGLHAWPFEILFGIVFFKKALQERRAAVVGHHLSHSLVDTRDVGSCREDDLPRHSQDERAVITHP